MEREPMLETMNPHLEWTDIALRLTLTVIIGVVIGYDRSEQGKAAGMRTTLLVCLAASVAMIEVNLLLPTAGRPEHSFVLNDVMRLPLGILTGVGFIGAGAIMRRDNIVVGITTAATLWLVTVIGLCIGGGQIGLGLAATGIGLSALWGLKWLDSRLVHKNHAQLSIAFSRDLGEREIIETLERAKLMPLGRHLQLDNATGLSRITLRVALRRREGDTDIPDEVRRLAENEAVRRLTWRMPDD
jgi:putative Mg2+ transporter-C (MgtC) family protein